MFSQNTIDAKQEVVKLLSYHSQLNQNNFDEQKKKQR